MSFKIVFLFRQTIGAFERCRWCWIGGKFLPSCVSILIVVFHSSLLDGGGGTYLMRHPDIFYYGLSLSKFRIHWKTHKGFQELWLKLHTCNVIGRLPFAGVLPMYTSTLLSARVVSYYLCEFEIEDDYQKTAIFKINLNSYSTGLILIKLLLSWNTP